MSNKHSDNAMVPMDALDPFVPSLAPDMPDNMTMTAKPLPKAANSQGIVPKIT
ncbi:hypothetical protein IMW82_08330 [Rhodanobacter sp. B2A1Ga4]|uniref:hypothetical protein n=1 Tax=Rhodanobacter TaxID=75309 RepID=UPI00131EE08A|nr:MULTISPECIES: hypothetical protein [Rhodanobacter]MBQ4854675.1 hypothetical protein [Rhodanobacter sp. B2A1Ga4]